MTWMYFGCALVSVIFFNPKMTRRPGGGLITSITHCAPPPILSKQLPKSLEVQSMTNDHSPNFQSQLINKFCFWLMWTFIDPKFVCQNPEQLGNSVSEDENPNWSKYIDM